MRYVKTSLVTQNLLMLELFNLAGFQSMRLTLGVVFLILRKT